MKQFDNIEKYLSYNILCYKTHSPYITLSKAPLHHTKGGDLYIMYPQRCDQLKEKKKTKNILGLCAT